MPFTHEAERPHWLRVVVVAGFGAFLVWQIVTRSLAAYLALEAPASALTLRPNEPAALVALADAALNPREAKDVAALDDREQRAGEDADRIAGWAETALKAAAAKLPLNSGERASAADARRAPLSEADKVTIRQRAEAALLEDPLNARALRILGQLADTAGDEARATKLMRAAADRSLGESVAVYWMLQQSIETKDYAKALHYADILLRKRPQLTAHVVPVLAQMAETSDSDGAGAIEAALAQRPPWRRPFLAALQPNIKDARTPLNLFLSLENGPAPPTKEELGDYLRFLIGRQLYELAYYTWLQFLPADELQRIGYLANAGFESEPSGLPFDWVVSQGAGATVDFAPLPGGDDAHALRLDLGPGRVEFRGVAQLLMLTPGDYRLKGRMKGELRGVRGLQWSVRCAGNSKRAPLGEGPMFTGMALTWSEFDFSFVVPPQAECRGQYLRLLLAARSASEQLA
jgi:hypothetical protein